MVISQPYYQKMANIHLYGAKPHCASLFKFKVWSLKQAFVT